jgi:Aldehyde dehydrogenase family
MIIMPDADMDQAVDALIGAGYGAAGERCMAISVAVPVGQATADELIKRLVPRVESLRVGPSTDLGADFGPLVTKAHLEKVKGYVDLGVQEGATLAVDGRNFTLQGYENGFYMGGCLFDNVTPDMRIYKEEIFGPVLSVVRAKDYEAGLALHPRRRCGPRFRRPRQRRHGRRQRANSRAARLLHLRRLETLRLRRSQPAWAGCLSLLHQDQDRDLALAVRHQAGSEFRDSHDVRMDGS